MSKVNKSIATPSARRSQRRTKRAQPQSARKSYATPKSSRSTTKSSKSKSEKKKKSSNSKKKKLNTSKKTKEATPAHTRGYQQCTSIDQSKYPGFNLQYKKVPKLCWIGTRKKRGHNGDSIIKQIYITMKEHWSHSAPAQLDFSVITQNMLPFHRMQYKQVVATYIEEYDAAVKELKEKFADSEIDKLFITDVTKVNKKALDILSTISDDVQKYIEEKDNDNKKKQNQLQPKPEKNRNIKTSKSNRIALTDITNTTNSSTIGKS